MLKKLKFIVAVAVVALGLSSQAFASTCSDQIANLQQEAPGGVTGMLFSGDLTGAAALDAEGYTTACLSAVTHAKQELQ